MKPLTRKQLIKEGCVIFQLPTGKFICVGPPGTTWRVEAMAPSTLRKRATEQLFLHKDEINF